VNKFVRPQAFDPRRTAHWTAIAARLEDIWLPWNGYQSRPQTNAVRPKDDHDRGDRGSPRLPGITQGFHALSGSFIKRGHVVLLKMVTPIACHTFAHKSIVHEGF